MSNFRQIKDTLPYSEKAAPHYEGFTINGFTPTHKTGGPAWNEGLRNATPVQHTNNKNDGKDIGRGKVITY
jgi:hypothetical protein